MPSGILPLMFLWKSRTVRPVPWPSAPYTVPKIGGMLRLKRAIVSANHTEWSSTPCPSEGSMFCRTGARGPSRSIRPSEKNSQVSESGVRVAAHLGYVAAAVVFGGSHNMVR